MSTLQRKMDAQSFPSHDSHSEPSAAERSAEVQQRIAKLREDVKNSPGDQQKEWELADLMLKEGTEEQKREAFATFSRLADAGHLRSRNGVGVCYSNGWVVPKDQAKALLHFLDAANRGLDRAQCNAGLCYLEGGDGVQQDYKLAVEWLRKSVAQGYPDAMVVLGECYAEGHGVEKDEK